MRRSIANERAIDDAVAIQEDGRARHLPTDSHFVCFDPRSGWETKRCQITAWKASECGVPVSAFTTGTMTDASATCAGGPPSRPGIPMTFAPTALACRVAATKFGLMFLSTSPPPPDKTNTAS